jgi:hypothetical protein
MTPKQKATATMIGFVLFIYASAVTDGWVFIVAAAVIAIVSIWYALVGVFEEFQNE